MTFPIADLVPLSIIAVSVAGAAGVGIQALGVWTHSKRLEIIGSGVSSAALQIHQDMAQLLPGVDVNAFKDAQTAKWVGLLATRNAGLIAKTGMPAALLAEKIDSAVHTLDMSSPTALTVSSTALEQAVVAKAAPFVAEVKALAPVVQAVAAAAAPAPAPAPVAVLVQPTAGQIVTPPSQT